MKVACSSWYIPDVAELLQSVQDDLSSNRFVQDIIKSSCQLNCVFIRSDSDDRRCGVHIDSRFYHTSSCFSINDWHANVHKDDIKLYTTHSTSDSLGTVTNNDTSTVQCIKYGFKNFAADRIIIGNETVNFPRTETTGSRAFAVSVLKRMWLVGDGNLRSSCNVSLLQISLTIA